MSPHDEYEIRRLFAALKVAIDAVDVLDLYNGEGVQESRLNQDVLAELRKARQ